MTKTEIIERLERFKELKDNWNGYGAEPFDKDFLNSMIKFINRFKEEWFDGLYVFPLPYNGIQLEYDFGYNEGNEFLEIEVCKDESKCSCLYGTYASEDEKTYRDAKEFKIKNDSTAIRRVLNKFKTGGFKNNNGRDSEGD